MAGRYCMKDQLRSPIRTHFNDAYWASDLNGLDKSPLSDVMELEKCSVEDTNESTRLRTAEEEELPAERVKFQLNMESDKRGEKERELLCGYPSCTPRWLQRFSSPRALLVTLCFLSAIQGFAVNGINNVNTTAIERRFQLPSSQVGFVSSAYDISAGVFVLFVSYVGAFGHKPRWLAVCAIILGLGSFIMALPHFTTGLYEYRGSGGQSCSVNETTTCDDQGLHNYFYVLILGQAFHGYAGTTMYTLGTITLDESVPVKDSPIYVGLMYGTSTLGPAIGYLLGGVFLDIYVDVDHGKVPDITSSDPRWVGAWWIGFIISGTMSLIVAAVLFCFPFELPTTQKVRESKVSQAHSNGSEDKANEPGFGLKARDIPSVTLIMLRNAPFMFITAAAVCEAILATGVATFLAKFLQNQFDQSASWSALLAGFLAVPGAAGGTVVGGLICRCMKLTARGMLKVGIITGAICLLFLGGLFVRCETNPTVGITGSDVDLTFPCNEQCSCDTQYYEPVCDPDSNIEYFSACHAGCVDHQNMTLCSCRSNSTTPLMPGKCSNDCTLLYLFLPLTFFVIFSTFLSTVPSASATLRVVPDKFRSFGLGIQWVFIRFLGSTVGPIVFGLIIDSTCTVWQETDCRERGSCWVYNNGAMATNFFVTCFCVKLVSIVFYFLANNRYVPPSEDKLVVTGSVAQITSSTADSLNGQATNSPGEDVKLGDIGQ